MMIKHAFFALLALVLLGSPQTVQSQQAPPGIVEDASPFSEAELVSEWESIQAGQPFTLALRLQMEDGWHSYWRNSGDSGQATAIHWDLPDGFSAGPVEWPYPQRFDLGPLTSYGYSGEVLLITEITPPDALEPGTFVALSGRATWLVCDAVCLTAEEDVQLSLPVSANPPAPSSSADAIAGVRDQLPTKFDSWEIGATRSASTYALRIRSESGLTTRLEGAQFFPNEKAVIAHAAPQPVTKDGDAYLMALQRSEYAMRPAERLQGVLVAPEGESWDREGRLRAMVVDVPVEEAAAATAPVSSRGSMTLLLALAFAFVGGLILNLMPCVFPILSIKLLGIAEIADARSRMTRTHGLVFGLGVVVSFWILAGLFLALRAAGLQIGWGFQLQSPLFVALLAMLFFGIGLNLMGVFEVGLGLMRLGGRVQSGSIATYRGSFLSGVLATLVATPCTAPLMGAALGFALTLPAAGALLVFTGLGMGMAMPYVALSSTPGLLKRLPRPGPWMETMRHFLAFPMFATTIWLVWVFGQQTGINGVASLLVGLLLLAGAAWMLGRWPRGQTSTVARMAARGFVVLCVAGAVGLTLVGAASQGPARSSSGAYGDWEAFSTARIEELRAEGRPVFVDFTAAWCLTCQVNKRTTLNSRTVLASFRERDVVLVKADWTNQDPEISAAIESFGRSGVPLYILYPSGRAEPIILPELLTERIVLDALNRLEARNPT